MQDRNQQKSITFLYTNNKHVKAKTATVPFTVELNKMKYLGINQQNTYRIYILKLHDVVKELKDRDERQDLRIHTSADSKVQSRRKSLT